MQIGTMIVVKERDKGHKGSGGCVYAALTHFFENLLAKGDEADSVPVVGKYLDDQEQQHQGLDLSGDCNHDGQND